MIHIPDDATKAAAEAIDDYLADGDEYLAVRLAMSALEAALPHLRRSQALACQGDTSTGSCSCFTTGRATGRGDSVRWLIRAANFADDKDAHAILRKAADMIETMSASTEGAAGESDIQAEGEADRARLGVDGTMGDAQDVWHPYVGSVHGRFCRVCGLARVHRKHLAGLYNAVDERFIMLGGAGE